MRGIKLTFRVAKKCLDMVPDTGHAHGTGASTDVRNRFIPPFY